jgi:leader peptidase (prepilin peptidase)/N-methyltransferase
LKEHENYSEGAIVLIIGIMVSLIAGLAIGFVVNILATRLPANRPVLGAITCTREPHPLTAWHYLPVVGYLRQRGKCATCGKALSFSYPLVEGGLAAIFAVLFLLEGWSLTFLFHTFYAAVLVLVLVIDLKHREIYLSVIAVGVLVSLLGSLVLPGMGVMNALAGAAVAGAFFMLAYLLAKILFPRVEEPLGLGDVYLALMMGTMLGFPNVVGALLIGPLLAGGAVLLLLISRQRKMGDLIPYGVALCIAALLFLVYPGPFAEALRLPALKAFILGLFGWS